MNPSSSLNGYGDDDYIGYVFRAEATKDFGFADEKVKNHYACFVPSDTSYKWLNEKEKIKENSVEIVCLRLLSETPCLGKVAKHSNKSYCVDLNRQIEKDYFLNFKPIARYTMDEAGKCGPWIPGEKAILEPLSEKERQKNNIALIQKSQKQYLRVYGWLDSDKGK